MGSLRYFVLFLFCITACKNGKPVESTVSGTLANNEETSSPLTAQFDLVEYPEALLKENGLEEWEEFVDLYEALERLKELDLRDVGVNIIGISARIKKIVSDTLPGGFETPQIRSRFKVVQMQTQKARYFTKHYKEDSLIPSLKTLYGHYNALLLRMQVLKQEESTVVSQTIPLN